MVWNLKDKIFKNWANMLTMAGLLMAVWLFLVAITYPEKLWLILLLAFLIGLTDFFDGKIARWLNIKSALGSALDRLRDKFFICPTLIILAWYHWPLQKKTPLMVTFTESLVVLMILIEILLLIYWVFGLIRKLDVSASKHGRRKMVFQFSAVMIWLISIAVEKYSGVGVFRFSIWFIWVILAIAIYLGMKSLEGYYQRYNNKT